MRIRIFFIIASAFSVALLSGCEKTGPDKSGATPAIKLTVSGVETKAKVITDKVHHSTYSNDIYDFIETNGFNITAYVTDKWEKDVIGHSGENAAGLYTDPVGGPLKDKLVTYYPAGNSSDCTQWVIAGNGDGSGISDSPAFSWINAVTMNFFAYAPAASAASGGTLSLGTVTSPYNQQPFTYTAKASSDEVTSANCEDLIFAFASHTATYGDDPTKDDYGKLVSGSSDKFSLTFYHALAQIRFCVDPAEFTGIKLISAKLVGPKSTTDPTKYVGIASKGDCTFAGSTNTFSWNSGTFANRYAYSQTFNGTSGVSFASGVPDSKWVASKYGTNQEKDLYTCAGDVLLVIPQTLTDCGVEVKIQVGTDEPVLLQGKLPATTGTSTNVSWEAGKYYTYKIGTTGTQEDLGLTMTLVDWAERENYIPID